MEKKFFFSSFDGIRLCGVWTFPVQPTTRAVILAHGITVDKDEDGIFTNLANELVTKGFAVFRFDFRGHGESEGNSVDVTLTGEIKDLESAFAEVTSKGYKHINLLGASFGGGIATLFAALHEKEIAKLCLWNPVLNYDHCFLNPALPWLVKRKGHMKQQVEKQGWSTLGRGFKVGKMLFDEMACMFPYKEIRKLRLLLIIIHGDKDMKVPYEDSATAAQENKHIQLITIAGADHGFHDSTAHAREANAATLNFFY